MIRIVAVLSILLMGCFHKTGDIIIAGSTSVQPFIERIAEDFMTKNPQVKINVQGGGSTAGIQAVFNKTCSIGTSSRHLHPSEQGLNVYLMAVDGIAVIVHPSNPIDDISHEQLRDIFAGRIKSWKEVGGPDKEIFAVTREEGSGTRGAFEELIMHNTAISDACLVQDSNGAIREIVANTPQAIGYISAGLVDERVKAIKIDGVAPTMENCKNGSYKFIRPFLLLTLEKPEGVVKSFIDYVLSDSAQQILRYEGLIPANIMNEREVF